MSNSFFKIYNKLPGYFLLILFCGYLGFNTIFPHTHIVDGVTVVHSHPYKSRSGNFPSQHDHSKNGFLLIQYVSDFIAITPVLYIGTGLIRKTLNITLLVRDENLGLDFYQYSTHLPRAPTFSC